jgi:hypothetical protein
MNGSIGELPLPSPPLGFFSERSCLYGTESRVSTVHTVAKSGLGTFPRTARLFRQAQIEWFDDSGKILVLEEKHSRDILDDGALLPRMDVGWRLGANVIPMSRRLGIAM